MLFSVRLPLSRRLTLFTKLRHIFDKFFIIDAQHVDRHVNHVNQKGRMTHEAFARHDFLRTRVNINRETKQRFGFRANLEKTIGRNRR